MILRQFFYITRLFLGDAGASVCNNGLVTWLVSVDPSDGIDKFCRSDK